METIDYNKMHSKWISLGYFSKMVARYIMIFTFYNEIGLISNRNNQENDKETRIMIDQYACLRFWGMDFVESCKQRQNLRKWFFEFFLLFLLVIF